MAEAQLPFFILHPVDQPSRVDHPSPLSFSLSTIQPSKP